MQYYHYNTKSDSRNNLQSRLLSFFVPLFHIAKHQFFFLANTARNTGQRPRRQKEKKKSINILGKDVLRAHLCRRPGITRAHNLRPPRPRPDVWIS